MSLCGDNNGTIMRFQNPINGAFSFPTVIDQAVSQMSVTDRQLAWGRSGRGIKVCTAESQLNDYLYLYGEIHVVKMRHFLRSVPFSEFGEKGVCIVDWGCGQGLATACTLDEIARRAVRAEIKGVRLIELSDVALARAGEIVRMYPDAHDVRQICWNLNEILRQGLDLPLGVPVLHLFSNILDVEAVDLKMLAEVFLKCTAGHQSYVLAVSPKSPLERAVRLKTFFELVSGSSPMDFSMESLAVADAKYYPYASCSCYGMVYRIAETAAEGAAPFIPDPVFTSDELIAFAAADMADETSEAVRCVNVDCANEDGFTPLIYAAKYGAISSLRVLLAAGADPNVQNAKGATALYFAAKGGQLDCVKALVESGADMELATTLTRVTPYMVASKYGCRDICNVLEDAGANVLARDYRGRSS